MAIFYFRISFRIYLYFYLRLREVKNKVCLISKEGREGKESPAKSRWLKVSFSEYIVNMLRRTKTEKRDFR